MSVTATLTSSLPARWEDRLAIRDLLESWVIWRDAGEWDLFRTLWHDDAQMNATWFKASAREFIAGCRKGFDAGAVVQHSHGASNIEIEGCRAFAQSKMMISQRGVLENIPVDVICRGRFFDALEKRDGTWGIVIRQPVYEMDHIIPLQPGATLNLDRELLDSMPEGYRHLGYLQEKMGLQVHRSLPGTRGPEVGALSKRIREWMDGGDTAMLFE